MLLAWRALHTADLLFLCAASLARVDPGPGSPVVISAFYKQWIRAESGRTLLLRDDELAPDLDPAKANMMASYRRYPLPYDIVDVCGRQANELYIAGAYEDGESVLEKWVCDVPAGAYFQSRVPSGTPLGTTVAGIPAVRIEIRGGKFLPLAERTPVPEPVRTELWRSKTVRDLRCVACDPEGRFVLFVAGAAPRTLYQLRLERGATPVALANAGRLPHLNEVVRCDVVQFETAGRAYQLTKTRLDGPEDEQTTLLLDPDNDGILDDMQTLGSVAYGRAGYGSRYPVTDFVWVR